MTIDEVKAHIKALATATGRTTGDFDKAWNALVAAIEAHAAEKVRVAVEAERGEGSAIREVHTTKEEAEKFLKQLADAPPPDPVYGYMRADEDEEE